MMFCLGATIGRQIGDPYLMCHLAAKSADLMLVNLPHCKIIQFHMCQIILKMWYVVTSHIYHNLRSLISLYSSYIYSETCVIVVTLHTGVTHDQVQNERGQSVMPPFRLVRLIMFRISSMIFNQTEL
jgi:hypothetical protein